MIFCFLTLSSTFLYSSATLAISWKKCVTCVSLRNLRNLLYSRFFKRLLSILISFDLFFVIPCVRRILLRSFVLIVTSVTSSIPNDSCSWISLKRVNKNKTHLILKFLALTFCDGLTLTGELKWGWLASQPHFNWLIKEDV